MDLCYVDKHFKELIKKGSLSAFANAYNLSELVEPGSQELAPTQEVYQLKRPIVPSKNRSVREFVEENKIRRVDLSEEPIVPHAIYASPSLEYKISETDYARVSSKSTIGRNNLQVRGFADHTGLIDCIRPGSEGTMWLEFQSQSFFMQIVPGSPLVQMKLFRDGATSAQTIDRINALTDENKKPLPFDSFRGDALVTFYSPSHSVVAYRAKKKAQDIVSLQSNSNDYRNFFDIVETNSKPEINLEQGRFYIMAGTEYVNVPIAYAAEMIKYADILAPIESHQAAFFNPGNFGRPAMEIVPVRDTPIEHGMPACFMKYYENIALPDKTYEGKFQNQGKKDKRPTLAKNFTVPE